MARSNIKVASRAAPKLRQLMELRGFNAKELAAASGINYIQLLKYLKDDDPTLPTDEALDKLTSALNVDVDDIFIEAAGGLRLDFLGEVAAAKKTTPLEIARGIGLDEKSLLAIANGSRPLLKSERDAIEKLWWEIFPHGLYEMESKVGRVPLVTKDNLDQVFSPFSQGVMEPDSEVAADHGLTAVKIPATESVRGGDPAKIVPPELERVELVVMEFGAWARRMALKNKSAVDSIETGVRKLINEVEEQSQPRAAPKDAKRA